jgi:integrase
MTTVPECTDGEASILQGLADTARRPIRAWVSKATLALARFAGWTDWLAVLSRSERDIWDQYRAFLEACPSVPGRRNPTILSLLCVARGTRFSVDRFRTLLSDARALARPKRERAADVASRQATTAGDDGRLVLEILQADGRPLRDPRYATTVLSVVRAAGWHGLHDLGVLDGPAIEQAVCAAIAAPADRIFARSVLVHARSSAVLDPHPYRFQTHWCALTHADTARFPALWRFPHAFGRRVLECYPDANEAEYVLSLASLWAQSRGGGTTEAIKRTHAAVGQQLMRLLRCRDYTDDTVRQRPWMDLLPRAIDDDALLSIVSCLCAAHNRRYRPRGGFTATMTESVTATRALLGTVNSLVLHHVLVAAHALSERAVLGAMEEWETRNPEHYASMPVARKEPVTRPVITDDFVVRLRGAARTAHEAAILGLLLDLGLRIGAIAHARLADVWDATDPPGRVLERARLLEKNCVRREVWLGPELVRHLQAYITVERNRPGAVLLFPNPSLRSPDVPCEGAITCVVRRLCRRVHLPVVNCHLFRHWVINRLIDRGNSLSFRAVPWVHCEDPRTDSEGPACLLPFSGETVFLFVCVMESDG